MSLQRRTPIIGVIAVFAGLIGVWSATAQTPLSTFRVANELERPIYVTHAPGDFERIFVIEKRGRIRVIKNDVLLATPFLDIDSIVGGGNSSNSEQGLLGLAFHPDYQNNGMFYVNYTNNSGHILVRRYNVDPGNPDVADDSTSTRIIRINQPFSNHNGGWIEFGPDGMLYIASGDGGLACDPGQRAQDLNELLGKMLRIDVNGDDFPDDNLNNYSIPPDNPFVGVAGRDEIWLVGLRNPWRCSFDRLTGDLYIADVGQVAREEINFVPAGMSGTNYGWDCKEGTECSSISGCGTSGCACDDSTLTDPFHEYNHNFGRCSITGGYVYRGCAIPDLQGTYFFADFCSAQVWSLVHDDPNGLIDPNSVVDRTTELDPPGGVFISNITSFGEDAHGEIYICDQGSSANNGKVFRIIPATCLSDVDSDLDVDLTDLVILLSSFGTTDGATRDQGDLDCDGDVDLIDLVVLLSEFGTICG